MTFVRIIVLYNRKCPSAFLHQRVQKTSDVLSNLDPIVYEMVPPKQQRWRRNNFNSELPGLKNWSAFLRRDFRVAFWSSPAISIDYQNVLQSTTVLAANARLGPSQRRRATNHRRCPSETARRGRQGDGYDQVRRIVRIRWVEQPLMWQPYCSRRLRRIYCQIR